MASGYELFITNDILIEYEEIISQKYNPMVAKNVVRALLLLPNVYKTEIYYSWNLIKDDADDNKFVDCAIAANAHVVVTEDKHFGILKNIEFPKVTVIDIAGFEKIFNSK